MKKDELIRNRVRDRESVSSLTAIGAERPGKLVPTRPPDQLTQLDHLRCELLQGELVLPIGGDWSAMHGYFPIIALPAWISSAARPMAT